MSKTFEQLGPVISALDKRLAQADAIVPALNPNVDGEFIWPVRSDGYWEIQSGAAVFHHVNGAYFLSSRFPISVKTGDVTHLKNTVGIKYFALFSSDGQTWETFTDTTNKDVTVTADGFVLITARKEPKSLKFSDDDIRYFFKNDLTIYRRDHKNTLIDVKNNIDNAVGILLNDASYCQVYVSGSSSVVNCAVSIPASIPCITGEKFYISSKLNASYPEYYESIALSVREQNQNRVTIARNDYTDLTNVIEYTVGNNDTTSLVFVIVLTKKTAESVAVGYYENVEYSLCVYSQKSGDDILDVMTESGDTWEV